MKSFISDEASPDTNDMAVVAVLPKDVFVGLSVDVPANLRDRPGAGRPTGGEIGSPHGSSLRLGHKNRYAHDTHTRR